MSDRVYVTICSARQLPLAADPDAPDEMSAAQTARKDPLPWSEGEREKLWRECYAVDTGLQAEFGDLETFIAFKRAEWAGRVNILRGAGRRGTPAASPSSIRPTAQVVSGVADAEAGWRAIFAQDPTLQAEFGSPNCYVAYMRAERAGLVTILRGPP